MFYKKTNSPLKKAFEGVEYKTLVYGDRTSLGEFHLKKDTIIPDHNHPHEQTGYMITGKAIFIIDGNRFEANSGDSWSIKSNVIHGVEVLENSVLIEVFSPVREDYL